MLQDDINFSRQLLDDSSSSQVNALIQNNSETKHARESQLRSDELE